MSFELSAVEKDSDTWANLYALFRVTDPENLGYGRDVRTSGHYTGLTPVCAWCITAPNRWNKYVAAVEEIQDALCCANLEEKLPSVTTKLDPVAEDLISLNDSANEKLLLHGTRPETLLTLMQNGLSERFSGGLFGNGSYLAEDPSKIDQYCIPDPQDNAQRLLHETLFENCCVTPVKDMLYVVVCRVALGFPVYTKDGETNLSPPHNSIFARDDKRELALIPLEEPDGIPVHYHSLIAEAGKKSDGYQCARHREFVVFDSSRIIEEYIIGYIRDMAPEHPHVPIQNVSQNNDNQEVRDAAVEAEGGGVPFPAMPTAKAPTKLFPIGGIRKAAGIAISPCCKFALVGTDDDEQPRLGHIDLQTGKLTFPYGDFQSPPFSVAIAPDGSFALVTDRPNDQVSRIDLLRGTVVQSFATGVETGNQVAISPCGNFALVACEEKQIARIDLSSSTAGQVSFPYEEPDFCPQGIAISPSGKFALISHEQGRGGIARLDLNDSSINDLYEDSRLGCCYHINMAPSGGFALIGSTPIHARVDLRTEEIAFADYYEEDCLGIQSPLCLSVAPSETFALITCQDTGQVFCISSSMASWKPPPTPDDYEPTSKRCCILL